MRKIAFLTHEFGLFKGHGGVASYLHLLVSRILEKAGISVYILTILYDEKSDLLKNKNLTLLPIAPTSQHEQSLQVLKHLIKIKPDCVESTDYLGYALESLVYRATSSQNALSNTVFITLHHTASRESFVWNDKIPIEFAPLHIRENFVREKTQMRISDVNVAPVNFMKNYVSRNYFLDDVLVIRHPTMLSIKSKKEIRAKTEKEFDLSMFKDKFIISCISRIEGRKNQLGLVQQFVKFVNETRANSLLILVGNTSINNVTGMPTNYELYESIPEDFKNRIQIFDFMGTAEKASILAISNVTVLASTFENSPISMNESICSGVPVIVSKYCGFSDYMGGIEEYTIFNPFEENDLSKTLNRFYKLPYKLKEKIADRQLTNLKLLSKDENTIDERLKLYFNSAPNQKTLNDNTLVFDGDNYLLPVNDETIRADYRNVMFFFDSSKFNKHECLYIFENIAGQFHDGEIIAYGGEMIHTTLIDFFIHDVPFFMKGIRFDEGMKGTPLWQTLIFQLDIKAETYCLLGSDGFNYTAKPVSPKKDAFKKIFLDYFFMQKNGVRMEDFYVE